VFKYKRLSDISISHRYNLCKSKTYSRVRKHFKKTCAKRSSSGERRKLTMEISPGYIRIGRVRQGDQGSVKRRLSYQRVDEVTQFEVVCSAKKIREQQKSPGQALLFNARLSRFSRKQGIQPELHSSSFRPKGRRITPGEV